MDRISRLGLGTANFGQAYGTSPLPLPLEECRAIIATARAAGIDTIDTATAYGNAEQRLDEIGVADFRVVTKVMGDEHIDGHFYGVLMHRPNPFLWPLLQRMKERGIAKKIGISIYSTTELDELMPECKFDLVQAPYNIDDQNLATSGWLQRLHDDGVEVHARSVLGRGSLLVRHSLFDCLSFALRHPCIDRVIVGVDSTAQLQEVIACERSQ